MNEFLRNPFFKRTEALPGKTRLHPSLPELPSPTIHNNLFGGKTKVQTMLPSMCHLRPQSLLPLPSLLLSSTSPSLHHHLRRSHATSSSSSDRTSDRVPTNDPQPSPEKANVSESNAAESGVSTLGVRSAPFREEVADAERQRQMQAPNRAEVWSRSQQPRARAMTGPRFEQTIMEYQVRGRLVYVFKSRKER